MFNSFIHSNRLIRYLSINSSNYQQFCSFCKNRQKFNYISKQYSNVFIEINTTFSAYRHQLTNQGFRSKRCFSTTIQRNQRLDQIYRNAVKEKPSPKTSKAEPMDEWQQLKAMSLYKKLKFMFVKYWYISIPVHCITSVLWFGTAYMVAKSGFDVKPILDTIKPYINKLPVPEFIHKVFNSDTNASSVGYVAIALILYKLVTPARYASTVGVSFYTIQHFVKRGLIKPVPSSHEIRAQVNQSRLKMNKVLRERLAKREELRKKSKNKQN